jgi:hypothetical protein
MECRLGEHHLDVVLPSNPAKSYCGRERLEHVGRSGRRGPRCHTQLGNSMENRRRRYQCQSRVHTVALRRMKASNSGLEVVRLLLCNSSGCRVPFHARSARKEPHPIAPTVNGSSERHFPRRPGSVQAVVRSGLLAWIASRFRIDGVPSSLSLVTRSSCTQCSPHHTSGQRVAYPNARQGSKR